MPPVVIKTGTVTGQIVVAIIDGEDEDSIPDIIYGQGAYLFRPSIDHVLYPDASPNPVTMALSPIRAILDSEGYICTPHPETNTPMYRGVTLPASNDPDASTMGWTWGAQPMLTNTQASIGIANFQLDPGQSRDLTTIVKVPSSPGVGIPQMEQLVIRAEQAAQDAAGSTPSGSISIDPEDSTVILLETNGSTIVQDQLDPTILILTI